MYFRETPRLVRIASINRELLLSTFRSYLEPQPANYYVLESEVLWKYGLVANTRPLLARVLQYAFLYSGVGSLELNFIYIAEEFFRFSPVGRTASLYNLYTGVRLYFCTYNVHERSVVLQNLHDYTRRYNTV